MVCTVTGIGFLASFGLMLVWVWVASVGLCIWFGCCNMVLIALAEIGGVWFYCLLNAISGF